MKRRSMFKALVSAGLAAFVPWRKSHADLKYVALPVYKSKFDPKFDAILRLGRTQLGHARQTGQKPVAMRLGKRERRIAQEGSRTASRILDKPHANPTTFAGLPIQWTDNECEMTVVTEKQ